MTFSIITPSFNQLDWLRLCVASVRDQVTEEQAERGGMMADNNPKSKIHHPKSKIPPLAVEHIIQDAGTPGIEDFAREIGADFYRDGKLVFLNENAECGMRNVELPGNSESKIQNPKSCYRVAVYCEADAGMYDAVNRGIRRARGDIVAYLNCDEQYLPQALQHVAVFFKSAPGTDVLFLDAIVVDSNGGYLCDRRVMVPTRLHTLVSGNLSVFTSSTFSRRAVFLDKGLYYNPSWKDVGDADWALRLIAHSLRMHAQNVPGSVFTDTGENMNIRPNALREKVEMRNLAPVWAKVAAPLIILGYRLRRAMAGIYRLHSHKYSIYTKISPKRRVTFTVEHPTFRWPGR